MEKILQNKCGGLKSYAICYLHISKDTRSGTGIMGVGEYAPMIVCRRQEAQATQHMVVGVALVYYFLN